MVKNIQRVVLDKGVINSLEERRSLERKFRDYEDKLSDKDGITVYFKTQPLLGSEVDPSNFVEDPNMVELLDGNVDHFFMKLRNPNTFKFEFMSDFYFNVKCSYMIYVEFDLNEYMGIIKEEVEDFSWCLQD